MLRPSTQINRPDDRINDRRGTAKEYESMTIANLTGIDGAQPHDERVTVTLTPAQAATLADEVRVNFSLERWTPPLDRRDIAAIREEIDGHERELAALREGEQFDEPLVFTGSASRLRYLSQALYEMGGDRLSAVGFDGRSETKASPENVASDRRQGHGMIETASVIYDALVTAGQVPS